MNGGGKLKRDPSGQSNFIAEAGESVTIGVASNEGSVIFAAARYGQESLHIERGAFISFQIRRGLEILSLSLAVSKGTRTIILLEVERGGRAHELVALRDWPGPLLNFAIMGIG